VIDEPAEEVVQEVLDDFDFKPGNLSQEDEVIAESII
jgi:hypothetical protein